MTKKDREKLDEQGGTSALMDDGGCSLVIDLASRELVRSDASPLCQDLLNKS